MTVAHRLPYIRNEGPLWIRTDFLPGGALPACVEWGMSGDDDPDEGDTVELGAFLDVVRITLQQRRRGA